MSSKIYRDIGAPKNIGLCIEGCGRPRHTVHSMLPPETRCKPCLLEYLAQVEAANKAMGRWTEGGMT
jgi:hypothetical protein